MTISTSLLRLAAAASAATALLVACGGGGGSTTEAPTASPLSYKLQTYITDNLATEYSKVWVTIKKITADKPMANIT